MNNSRFSLNKSIPLKAESAAMLILILILTDDFRGVNVDNQ